MSGGWSLPFDGGLVAWGGSPPTLRLLNAGAAAAHLLAEAGLTREEAAAEIAARNGVDAGRVLADLAAMASRPPAAAPPRGDGPRGTGPEVQRTFDLGGVAASVRGRVGDPATTHVHAILSPLATGGDHAFEVAIEAGPDGGWVVRGPRGVTRDVGHADEAAGAAFAALLCGRRPDHRPMATLHGACVALDGRALALCGACGSGKSTLAALLAAEGASHYADDMVPLSLPDGRVTPWGAPGSVKRGSWDVLSGVAPALATAPAGPKGARLLVRPSTTWDLPQAPLAALLFPRHAPGRPASLGRLSPTVALARLMADRAFLGDPPTEAVVGAFLDVLARVGAWEATYPDGDAGLRVARSLLAGGGPSG